MKIQPRTINTDHIGSGKLMNKVSLITCGDSGKGRTVAVAFAKEGCDITNCEISIEQVIKSLGGLDILVNN